MSGSSVPGRGVCSKVPSPAAFADGLQLLFHMHTDRHRQVGDVNLSKLLVARKGPEHPALDLPCDILWVWGHGEASALLSKGMPRGEQFALVIQGENSLHRLSRGLGFSFPSRLFVGEGRREGRWKGGSEGKIERKKEEMK